MWCWRWRREFNRGRTKELCRLAAQKFGDDTARQLAALLEQAADPDRLTQAGIGIIECETGTELLDRISR